MLDDVVKDSCGFVWARWEPVSSDCVLPPGTHVAVDWRSAKLEGYRGVVVEPDDNSRACENAECGRDCSSSSSRGNRTKHKVQVLETGRMIDVSRRHIKPVLTAGNHRIVVVVFSTAEYRQLARSHISAGDAAVEVGACYGDTTEVLRVRSRGLALGVDISDKVIAQARARFPECRFEVCDVLSRVDLSTKLPSPSTEVVRQCGRTTPRMAAFIDVGGERAADAVLGAVKWAQECLNPDFVCVKSEHLASMMSGCNDAPLVAMQFRLVTPPHEQIALSLQTAQAARGPRKDTQYGERWYESVGLDMPDARRSVLKGGHPLKYPPRRSQTTGKMICRHFNYGVCFRGDACSYDHTTCHHCRGLGHTAKNCPCAFTDLATGGPPLEDDKRSHITGPASEHGQIDGSGRHWMFSAASPLFCTPFGCFAPLRRWLQLT